MYRIVDKQVLGPVVKLLEIEAPEVARKAKAGQFVIIRLDEEGERVPLTVADLDLEKGTVTVIIQELGYSSRKLGLLETGDYVADFVGPLGQPSVIKKYGTVVVTGGGLGIAPCYPIAKAMKEAGNRVISIIGFRNKDLVFWEDKLREASTELLITTDDGSYVRKGFGTHVLQELIDAGEKIDLVIAIGPMPMMQATCELTRPYKIPTRISMNSIMVDGTGMCGACRVTVDGETKFACCDGPEFDGHLIDFAEQRRRGAMYRDKEAIANEKFEHEAHGGCGGGCHNE